ncbi:MAG: hypothetical protein JWN07_1522 [Hyphomicrobiales bacterium]|nr:hypothetical protein [Hyphomicrobiales bacterium]
MLAGENLMGIDQKAAKGAETASKGEVSDSLADSSLNEAPAPLGGPPSEGEATRKVPQNDQREGLAKAEATGKSPAKP